MRPRQPVHEVGERAAEPATFSSEQCLVRLVPLQPAQIAVVREEAAQRVPKDRRGERPVRYSELVSREVRIREEVQPLLDRRLVVTNDHQPVADRPVEAGILHAPQHRGSGLPAEFPERPVQAGPGALANMVVVHAFIAARQPVNSRQATILGPREPTPHAPLGDLQGPGRNHDLRS